jgi:hypothetical protein
MAGEYICPVCYPNEYGALESESARDEVDAWLLNLNMRLARVGDDGAWFMSHSAITDRAITFVKGELLKFRDEYGPAVLMLDFIRQAKAENAQCVPGERIQLVELEMLVNGSTTLSAQLRSLVDVIHSGGARLSDRENLRRLMDHLAKDGYTMLIDKGTDAYRVTGKVEQLYCVLAYLDDNKLIDESGPDDQLDLVDSIPSDSSVES